MTTDIVTTTTTAPVPAVVDQSGAASDADFIRLFLHNRCRNSNNTLRAYTRTLEDFVSFVGKRYVSIAKHEGPDLIILQILNGLVKSRAMLTGMREWVHWVNNSSMSPLQMRVRKVACCDPRLD